MNKNTLNLGIESSCDETAASVVKNGNEIISSVVASQLESPNRFGGVVPEIASRHHVEQITLVIEEALKQANVTMDDLDGVAVTEGPGLVGALLIGVNAAKTLAFMHNLPLVGVHHIAGHIYANRFETEFKFPLLSL
ncbi:tRNA (adenosine(37)-N6)-threonylcarbamoyltransferase complex transferase subunit TsaD, partial [Escherichia coli]